MKGFKLEIPQPEVKNDLTIIYEEGKDKFHKIITSKDDFIKALQYFENKRSEINQTKLVYIQENISFDIFDSFISSIKTKSIFINEDNYKNYYYLSNKYEYKELQAQIEKFINTRPDIISIIDQMTTSFASTNEEGDENKEQIDFAKEEIIAKNLDICLINGNLKKLPLPMLIRILNSPKRQLKDHSLLFSFIKEIINEKRKQDIQDDADLQNLLILPSCLDYCLMNSTEIEELFKIEGSMPFFSPRNAEDRMKIFISKEKELFERFSEIESKMKEMEQNFNQRFLSLENKSKSQQEQIMNDNEKSIKKFNQNDEKLNEIERNITEIQSLQKNQIKTAETQNGEILLRIQKLEKSDENIKLKQKTIETQNSEFLSRIQKLEKSDEITRKKQKTTEDEVKNHNSRISKNENSIDEVKKKIESEVKKITEIKKLSEKILFENDPKTIEFKQGIFKYLFDKLKTNPITKGLIKIDGNFRYSNEASIMHNLIDSNWSSSFWISENKSNSYITIDFKNNLVMINKYRIRVGRTDGTAFFSSWILKGVTEDNREVVLDEVSNSSEITKSHPETTVLVSNHQIVRSVQLIMKGKSNDNDYHMRLRNIELFGYFKSDLT